MINKLQQHWHWLIFAFLGLMVTFGCVSWTFIFIGGSSSAFPSELTSILLFGGCPGIIWLVIVVCYFGLPICSDNLVPPEPKPRPNLKRRALYFLALYIVCIIMSVIITILAFQAFLFPDWEY